MAQLPEFIDTDRITKQFIGHALDALVAVKKLENAQDVGRPVLASEYQAAMRVFDDAFMWAYEFTICPAAALRQNLEVHAGQMARSEAYSG